MGKAWCGMGSAGGWSGVSRRPCALRQASPCAAADQAPFSVSSLPPGPTSFGSALKEYNGEEKSLKRKPQIRNGINATLSFTKELGTYYNFVRKRQEGEDEEKYSRIKIYANYCLITEPSRSPKKTLASGKQQTISLRLGRGEKPLWHPGRLPGEGFLWVCSTAHTCFREHLLKDGSWRGWGRSVRTPWDLGRTLMEHLWWNEFC